MNRLCKDSAVSCQDLDVFFSVMLMRYSVMTPLGVEGGCQDREMEWEEVGTPVRLGALDGAGKIFFLRFQWKIFLILYKYVTAVLMLHEFINYNYTYLFGEC